VTPNDTSGEAPDEPTESAESARARRRAELPPPGTVQEEAALLVDLLSQRGWVQSPGMPSDSGSSSRSEEHAEPGAAHGEHDCTCGGRTPAACKVCPVCQLIAFVQQVNPETIEKVADFVGFAATALRDLASAQRERQRAGEDGEHRDDGGPDGGLSE